MQKRPTNNTVADLAPWGGQEKLRLEEDDEVAIEWMQQLINESSSQVMANIMETTHRWAQALR